MKSFSLNYLLIIIFFFTACKKSVFINPELPDTVSFQKHIVPIFNNNCNTSGCHSGNSPQAGLNLESGKAYKQLWAKSMLDTLHPKNSLLYFQMTSSDKPMPPSGLLDTFYTKEVLKWIQQGAKNN